MSLMRWFHENPDARGAQVVLPSCRPGAPGAPFQVEKSGIFAEERYGSLRLERDKALRKNPLVPNDLLLHTHTGVICRVVGMSGPWNARIEAWSPPEGEQEFAYWNKHGGRGEWVCWGYAVMEGEQFPSWFPIQPVQVMDARDEEGRFRPEYVEAYMDSNPGVRKGAQVHKRPLQRTTPHPEAVRIFNEHREKIRRAIERGEFELHEEHHRKFEEPLDSDGDVRIRPLLPE